MFPITTEMIFTFFAELRHKNVEMGTLGAFLSVPFMVITFLAVVGDTV